MKFIGAKELAKKTRLSDGYIRGILRLKSVPSYHVAGLLATLTGTDPEVWESAAGLRKNPYVIDYLENHAVPKEEAQKLAKELIAEMSGSSFMEQEVSRLNKKVSSLSRDLLDINEKLDAVLNILQKKKTVSYITTTPLTLPGLDNRMSS